MPPPSDLSDAARQALDARYRVEGELGQGGMATVYTATDLKHGRRVALKVLRADVANLIGPERFLREIAIAARLNHPNILALFDSGEAAGTLYYVMPLVDGESLRDRLRREHRLTLEQALQIVRQIADGLTHANAMGVIHRDIKPENILLSGSHAVLADFGIARALNAASNETVTQTGLVVGTPAYMSPEQAFGEGHLDARADQYSLACVLYEMLAGSPPWQGPTPQATLGRRLTEPVPPLQAARDDIPPGLDEVLSRALAREPEDRFPTVAAFVEALAAGREGVPARVASDAIAVLEFTNLSRDPALDWLATGLAETVTVDLKRIPGLRVIARQALARAAAAGPPVLDPEGLRRLGAAVGARWIVQGSFQSAGGRIRVMPQFHEATSGALLRAGKFDGAIEDLFELQDRIVEDLMRALDAPLTTSEQQRIARPETSQLGAYEEYAKGLQNFYRFGEAAFRDAEAHYLRAVALDPEYALAHAGLGSLAIFRYIGTTDPADLERGIERLGRAIAIDPDLADAHHWLCYACFRAHREEAALAAGARATALDPGNALGWYFLAVAQSAHGSRTGRWELLVESARSYGRSLEEDASHLPTYMGLAYLHLNAGAYAVAARILEVAIELEREGRVRGHVLSGGAQLLRGGIHLRLGELEQASTLFARGLELLERTEHVYRDLFTALTRHSQGEVAFRRRAFDVAVSHFARALEVIAANPARLGMGLARARALLGQARAFHGLGMRREAAARLAEAEGLVQGREGFDFSWAWEANEASMLFEQGYTQAVFGRGDAAVKSVAAAVELGWSEAVALEDRAFAALRRGGALDPVRERLGARAPLPQPPELSAGD